MKAIEWSEPAVSDLVAVRDYIARDSQQYADRFVEKIFDSVEKLQQFPELGRRVRETNDELVREVIHQNYRIIYRAEPERVLVLAVLHGGRNLEQVDPKPWETF